MDPEYGALFDDILALIASNKLFHIDLKSIKSEGCAMIIRYRNVTIELDSAGQTFLEELLTVIPAQSPTRSTRHVTDVETSSEADEQLRTCISEWNFRCN